MRKRTLKHLLCWAVWYGLNSLPILHMTMTPDKWWQLAYNYSSLLIVFYALVGLSYHYFQGVSLVAMENKTGLEKARYLFFRWQILAAAAVVISYIATSVWLDTAYFGYQYENLQAHIDQRFIRQLAYSLVGAGYGFYLWEKRRSKARLETLKTRVVDLQAHVLKQQNNQRTIAELENRITANL